jgi:L-ribulose-5-phosphate 4-epimerase
MYEELRKSVCDANIELQERNLVIYSWGNVSGINREEGIVGIKPSGVPYEDLTPDKIVLMDLDGQIVDGDMKPSSDTPTHLELYKNFYSIGGICHAHSVSATVWAQAQREIPCLGTTHADYFYGPIPVTAPMTDNDIQGNYELNTGMAIIRRFAGLDPMKIPAVLVANHGPFTWGLNPDEAVEAMAVLEEIATMAIDTLILNPNQTQISKLLLDKHYLRKHGENAYYGQKDK